MNSSPVFAAVFCVAALTIGFTACAKEPAVELVSLEGANSPGSSPWMDSTTAADLPRQVNRVEDRSGASATSTLSGGQLGLYGGSTDKAVCDRDEMVRFLEQNSAQAEAWRSVTRVTDIRAYASALSPVVLTHDTRVTNHGFNNGQATTFQSVLQTGTAVMIDNRGVPRVRCDSGSPLGEPQNVVGEEFTGTGWQGLDRDAVVVVRKSDVPIEKLELVPLPRAASPPISPVVEMGFGDDVASWAPDIELPPGDILVPVDVTSLTTSATASVTPSVTTSTPSTTTTTETPSSSVTSTESPTSTVPTTTEDDVVTIVPTEDVPQGGLVPSEGDSLIEDTVIGGPIAQP